jgi:DNA repair protein RadC
MRKFSIKDWADEDQPRSKLLNKGPHILSEAELLSILINSGTADNSALDLAKALLHATNNSLRQLASLSVKELLLLKIKGIGEARAVTIVAALELGIRRSAAGSRKTLVARSSDMAAYLRGHLGYRKKEVFVVVFLNGGNRVVHIETVSEGGLTGTVADPRVILKKALENEATALILCHNHPSGNLRPSHADEMLTQKIKHAAAFLDIRIMDHLIVSDEGYFSFADEGML